jgi:hypothetical protein
MKKDLWDSIANVILIVGWVIIMILMIVIH